ncbi:MAG: hypothetical protein RLZZ71_563 [Bacteroidota bacterium]|jgi:hypothetical protein
MFKKVKIQFLHEGQMQELITKIVDLKKEKHEEIMYTECNQRIPVQRLISINGLSFEI